MAMIPHRKRQKGYSLIEIIVVVSMLGLLMPAVFSILYAILQQQLKVYRITETKRQGDLILSFMKEKIGRDAARIYETGPVYLCETPNATTTTTNGNDFLFLDASGNTFWFILDTGSIKYRTGGISTSLNSTQILLSNFEIGCIRRGTNTLVQFSYTATFQDVTPTVEEGTVALNYVTKIRLR